MDDQSVEAYLVNSDVDVVSPRPFPVQREMTGSNTVATLVLFRRRTWP